MSYLLEAVSHARYVSAGSHCGNLIWVGVAADGFNANGHQGMQINFPAKDERVFYVKVVAYLGGGGF